MNSLITVNNQVQVGSLCSFPETRFGAEVHIRTETDYVVVVRVVVMHFHTAEKLHMDQVVRIGVEYTPC